MEILIGFSKSSKIGSRLIRFCEGSEFSHVYVKWSSAYLDRDIIYHASGHAVGFVTTKNFLANKNEIVLEKHLAVSPETKKRIVQFCMDNSGVGYGVKHLLGFGVVKLCKLFGKKIKNPFGDGPKTYICSELAAEIINLTGRDIKELDDVTPSMIYEALRG